jgi:Holliday junction resolvase RusA-like endonuclease
MSLSYESKAYYETDSYGGILDLIINPKKVTQALEMWASYEEGNPWYQLEMEFEGLHDAAKRPRVSSFGGRARAYDPGATEKNRIRIIVGTYLVDQGLAEWEDIKKGHIKGWDKIRGEIHLRMEYWVPLRSDFNGVQKILARMGLLRPLHKPDVNNLAKEFEDALNEMLWADDSQIVSESVDKYYCVSEVEGEEEARLHPRMRFTVSFRVNAPEFKKRKV